MRQNIKLSTGAEVTHKVMSNGVISVELTNGNNMTDSEWKEYCRLLNAANLEKTKKARTKRIADNHTKFNNVKGKVS